MDAMTDPELEDIADMIVNMRPAQQRAAIMCLAKAVKHFGLSPIEAIANPEIVDKLVDEAVFANFPS